MKMRIMAALLAAVLVNAANAQYRKAGFFNKDGRIYEIGPALRYDFSGKGFGAGIHYAVGREQDGKRLHHWFSNEIYAPFNTTYKYTSYDFTTNTVKTLTEKVKTKVVACVNYTLAYNLLDIDRDEKVLSPYISLGVGGETALTNNSEDYQGGVVISPGAGFQYHLNERNSINLSGTYNFVYDFDGRYKGSDSKNHLGLKLSFRIRIVED